jgi:hypothetical protein
VNYIRNSASSQTGFCKTTLGFKLCVTMSNLGCQRLDTLRIREHQAIGVSVSSVPSVVRFEEASPRRAPRAQRRSGVNADPRFGGFAKCSRKTSERSMIRACVDA